MKFLLIILLISVSTVSFSQNGEKNFIDQNYIEVTGTAELEVVPNLIYLGISINEKDNKNRTPLSELEKQLTDKLSAIGIDLSKDLLIKDMSSDFKNSILIRSGVLLSKDYQVIVRDPKIVNKVFIELEKVGISNITIDRLDHTEILQYRKEVKVNAIKAAKDKAIALAEAIDQSIGKAIYILENGTAPRQVAANTMGAVHRGYAVSEDLMLVTEFEKIKLAYSVLCRFELK